MAQEAYESGGYWIFAVHPAARNVIDEIEAKHYFVVAKGKDEFEILHTSIKEFPKIYFCVKSKMTEAELAEILSCYVGRLVEPAELTEQSFRILGDGTESAESIVELQNLLGLEIMPSIKSGDQ